MATHTRLYIASTSVLRAKIRSASATPAEGAAKTGGEGSAPGTLSVATTSAPASRSAPIRKEPATQGSTVDAGPWAHLRNAARVSSTRVSKPAAQGATAARTPSIAEDGKPRKVVAPSARLPAGRKPPK